MKASLESIVTVLLDTTDKTMIVYGLILSKRWHLTGFNGDVSQLENSSQNAKNVALFFFGEP